MTLRLLKRVLSADALGLILVVFALQTMTSGIASSLQGTDTTHLFVVCLIAALTGLLLNKSNRNGIQAAVAIGALGVIGVWIVGARLAYPLLDLLRSVVELVPVIVPAIRERIPIDTTAVLESWSVVTQASTSLLLRWQGWLASLSSDAPLNDALVRNMIWTLLMWLLAAWTGWFAGRRNAILSLLPNVILLAAVISYSEYRAETLWLMVFIMLLLMGVWNYKNHTTQWERRRVDYSDSIRYDNTQAVLFLAISIGVVAFITPSVSWRQIRDFLRERDRSNEAAEVLGIQQQKVTGHAVPVQKPSLPREHLLTGGFAQSEKLVMTIRTGELPPIVISSVTTEAPRYYWRSTIYDSYVGAGWVTSSAPPQDYRANTPLISGLLNRYRPLHLDVQLQEPEEKLFWSGVLYSASIPFRANWRTRPQSSLFADQTDLLRADIFMASSSATSYQADVYIPTASIEELRSASTTYPEEIRQRYVALPEWIPWRVVQLAKQVTAGKNTPYDKAKAIESYLRTNYPYDLEVPAPPQDQDVADYFLFDLRRGYCDYYATAMVVLARSSGIPARFVSGYSPGSYDAPNAQYRIRELNAHSWPEVYFPEYGWIEFEPTGSQPEIERPEKTTESQSTDETATPASRFLFQLTTTRLLYWLSSLFIVLFLVILYFAAIEKMLLMSLAPSKAVELLYRRYYRLGRPLAGARTRSETAYEFTEKLIRRYEDISARSKHIKWLKHIEAQALQFTNIYLSSMFSQHTIQKSDAGTAFNIWKHLRRQLIIARINIFLLNIPLRKKQRRGRDVKM